MQTNPNFSINTHSSVKHVRSLTSPVVPLNLQEVHFTGVWSSTILNIRSSGKELDLHPLGWTDLQQHPHYLYTIRDMQLTDLQPLQNYKSTNCTSLLYTIRDKPEYLLQKSHGDSNCHYVTGRHRVEHAGTPPEISEIVWFRNHRLPFILSITGCHSGWNIQ